MIGFVFQSFNLLARTTSYQNVELPLIYAGMKAAVRSERVAAAIESVGLTDRRTHKPNELSGGQRQRVAIARAVVNNPSLLLADEPTGNLDSKTGKVILGLLDELNRQDGTTIVVITHDHAVAARMPRQLEILDGRMVRDSAMQVAA